MDPSPLLCALLSVTAVSAVSLAGAVTFLFSGAAFHRTVFFLVSFAAGSLMGGAFLHLLPEAAEIEGGISLSLSLWICGGILIFFLLEKFLAWRHCHQIPNPEHPHRMSMINLVGDALHNFLDGLIISAAFLADPQVGLATTVAVLLHEIPQEIADMAVLLYSGLSRGRAVLYNLLSALCAFLGVGLVFIVGPAFKGALETALLPVTAGAFIYVSGSDLIPELHKETSPAVSAFQVILLASGLGLMLVLRLLPA